MQAESTVRAPRTGQWAFGCSLISVILFGVAIWMIVESFCFGDCPAVPRIYRDMLWVTGVGFPAGIVATGVLSIRALVLHRQRPWAVSALIVMFLPVAALGSLMFLV